MSFVKNEQSKILYEGIEKHRTERVLYENTLSLVLNIVMSWKIYQTGKTKLFRKVVLMLLLCGRQHGNLQPKPNLKTWLKITLCPNPQNWQIEISPNSLHHISGCHCKEILITGPIKNLVKPQASRVAARVPGVCLPHLRRLQPSISGMVFLSTWTYHVQWVEFDRPWITTNPTKPMKTPGWNQIDVYFCMASTHH